MALEVKQFNCPHCGASLSVQNARKAKILICNSCGSQIDLTSPEYAIMGQAIPGDATPESPIRLGQFATFDGVKWMVVGRVRYRDEEFWDEWLLMTEEGKYQWLVDSDGKFTMYEPFAPANPVDPNQVSRTVNLEGFDASVTEHGEATIEYLEGELTWKARVGDTMRYLEAEHDGGVYSIEWTEREIEFFKGGEVSRSAVYLAFGLAAAKPAAGVPGLSRLAVGGGAASSVALIVALVVIFVILCICCSVCGGCSPSESDGGGLPSIRIGSPSGGGSFGGGGGFSGGK